MRGLQLGAVAGFVLAIACGDDDSHPEPDAHVDRDAATDASNDATIDGALTDASTDNDAGFDPGAVQCFAGLMAPSEAFVSVQRFVSEDGAIKLWRARQPGNRSGAAGETWPYDLVRVWVDGPRDRDVCVTELSVLSYDFAHHNWDDTWSVTTESTRYEVNELYAFSDNGDVAWVDTLRVFDANDVAVDGTQTLVADGCSSLPYDLNPCMQRVRVDVPPPGWGE